MRSHFIGFAIPIFLVLAACSDDSAGTSGGGGTATEEAYTPPLKAKVGAVNVFVRPQSPGDPPAFYAAGYFLDYAKIGGGIPDGYSRGGSMAEGCTKKTSGACELVRCNLVPSSGLTFATPKYVSAGDITAKRASGGELKMTPDAQNTYLGSSAGPAAVSDGETVTITATGGDVPAFSETVTFAKVVTPGSPKIEVGDGSDANVTWSGAGSNGTVVVAGETGTEGAGFVANLSCRFDAAAGKGTIPGVLLKDLGGNEFSMGITNATTTKDIGGFEVSFVAETSGDIAENGFLLSVK